MMDVDCRRMLALLVLFSLAPVAGAGEKGTAALSAPLCHRGDWRPGQGGACRVPGVLLQAAACRWSRQARNPGPPGARQRTCRAAVGSDCPAGIHGPRPPACRHTDPAHWRRPGLCRRQCGRGYGSPPTQRAQACRSRPTIARAAGYGCEGKGPPGFSFSARKPDGGLKRVVHAMVVWCRRLWTGPGRRWMRRWRP